MAQKTAPTKVGNKKAAKKAPDRKAHHAAPAKSVKAKPKAAPPKAPVQHAAKSASARPQAQKAASHTPKAAPRSASASHKAPLKEAAKAHAAPKHETAKPAAAPSRETAKAPIMPPPARPAAPSAARAIPAAVAKTASQKIIAPASPAAQQPVAAPQATTAAQALQQSAAAKAAAAAAAAAKKPVHQRHGFKVSEWIVYPAHGVGRIVAIEEQEIAGISLELFVITFEKDKMTLRVPTGKSESVGMRKLAEEPTVKKAIETLKGRARVKRTMWSRRAQEYEAKINSGDLISIAEVVRDLYRSESQPEQSYSERQLYEAALDRMAREISVVEKLDERGAVQRITEVLAKSARGRGVAAEAA